MFRQMLMAGASRAVFAPENDQGSEPDPDEPDAGAPEGDADDDLPPDEGDGDDAGDDEGDRPDDDEPPASAAPRRRGANETIRNLRAERQDRDRRIADLERQVAEQVNRRPQVDPAREEAEFQARIADLPFEQQLLAVRDRERQVVGQQLTGLRAELAGLRDESRFNRLVASNPTAARHETEVERQAAAYAARGVFVEREVILKNILGDLALKRGPAARQRDGDRAAGNVRRNQGRPGAARSDAAAGRPDRNSLEAIEERLRNVPLDQI